MIVKATAHSQASQPILIEIRRPDEKQGNSDHGIAQVLNENLSSVGETLSSKLQACSQEHRCAPVTRVMH